MIYIRTDANNEIATGHVMRCITIADKLKQQGVEVCFVVSDEESTPLICEKNFLTIVMNVNWEKPDIEKEFSVLKHKIHDGDALLVDSYFITNDYLKKFKTIMKVITFDDLFLEKKDADIIINYNVFYRRFDYTNRYQGESCNLLLGERYVPLREQFCKVKRVEQAKKGDHPEVLLICGGGDKNDLILGVLKWMYEKENDEFFRCSWNIVIGKYYENRKELMEFSENCSNIRVMENITEMAQMMSQCDLCISAASTVLYECCAVLLPTLFFVVSEDQLYDAKYFKKDGMMLYCGNYLMEKETSLSQLGKYVKELLKNPHKMQEMKDKMRNFFDTEGTNRIVEEILNL